MGGQTAEQTIAGVVLGERLAVTMYGAIHRAQFAGQRNLRGIVVDSNLLEDPEFRSSLTDGKHVDKIVRLEHPNIVPTVTVEASPNEVVIVTRGVGRYVTVQDLIAAATARGKQAGKLSMPIAGRIGRSVLEALAAAHRAGVIHGAVHPRSVLVDEDGGVRLGDFIAGRALTSAVARGGDSSLLRGLTGYIAPELVVGDEPKPAVDVFAVGAMLFTMLSGEVPPGSLRATPAVERLVQRALDTDTTRRYKTAADMLENLLEALEDDRWELAERGDLIKEAGLSQSDDNIDDATEDLLASLGKSAMQVTSPRAQSSPAPAPRAVSNGGRLDALLANLGDDTGLTQVDDIPPKRRDPISAIIRKDPRAGEAIVSAARVPSLDDDDDGEARPRRTRVDTPRGGARTPSSDEAAALAAIGDLDSPARRISTAAEQASAAAAKLAEAAARAERAAAAAESEPVAAIKRTPPRAAPIVEPIVIDDVPPPRIKSRIPGLIALAVLGAGGVGFYLVYKDQQKKNTAAEARKQQELAEKEALEAKLRAELPDPGTLKVTSAPAEAGVWLKLGRTPLDSIPLSSGQLHEIRLEGLDGFQPIDTQVMPIHWSGEKDKRRGQLTVPLRPIAKSAKGKAEPVKLAAMPPKPPDAFGFVPGRGPLHIESTPSGAEVWLYVGMTNQMQLANIQAGAAYELKVLKDGYLPGYVAIQPDEWRDNPADTQVPINVAKKKSVLERNVELVPDPMAKGK